MTDDNNRHNGDAEHGINEHSDPDSSDEITDSPEDGAIDPAARIEELEQTVAALTERLEVESKPQRDHITRRSVLGMLGIAGLVGLGSGTASAAPQGQIGTPSRPLANLYTTRVEGPQAELFLLANGYFVGTFVQDGNEADVLLGTNASNGGASGSAGRTVGGGASNAASGENATVAGGGSNTASGLASTIGGGLRNEATEHYTTVTGGKSNVATRDYAAIGGGDSNDANGGASAIGGGYNNVAKGYGSTVGGGGDRSDDSRGNVSYTNYSTVGGGQNNEAGADGSIATDEYATVGGGVTNTASANASTVAGGENNEATDIYATVAGGQNNSATAPNSFAAGTKANAGHEGAFVWSDTSAGGIGSAKADEFVVSARGGTYIFSNETATTGVQLSPGSGSWSSASSRALKSDVEPISGEAVLDRVTDLDISTWSYDSQDGVRHMGPMAEEFHEGFELGADEEKISNVDADGVALGAIQGLAERGEDRDAKLESQEDRIETLEHENDALRERLAALEAQIEDTS
jgi:hypothetical protein